MKITLSIIMLVLILIYISEPTISFKPFSISFNSGYTAIGILFLWLSFLFMKFDIYDKAYKKGYSEAYQIKLDQVEKNYGKTAYEEGFKDGVNSKNE